VVATLDGGRPANVADLHALVLAELDAVLAEIEQGDSSGRRTFRNHSRDSRKPVLESDARDRLLDRLRPRLRPVDVEIEPEGRYARDRRADLEALAPGADVPIELKRHFHSDVFTAATRQLSERYSRHPAARGYGIFLVLWFGCADAPQPPAPPGGAPRPTSAAEMRLTVERLLAPDLRARIAVRCMDVSL
jgi:hypothetical protein